MGYAETKPQVARKIRAWSEDRLQFRVPRIQPHFPESPREALAKLGWDLDHVVDRQSGK